MITSKFIWEAFEKYADELFYVNNSQSVSYKQFYQKVTQIAKQKELLINRNKRIAFEIDSCLDTLIMFFALLYSNTIPALLSAHAPKKQVEDLLVSIESQDSITAEDATIIFTSGSSSISKAVLHTYSNHYYSALSSNENIRLQKNDKWLLSLPMHHIGGLSIIFRILLAGGTLVGYDKAVSLEDTINIHKVTHVSVVATQLRRMMQYPEKLNSLKAILVGGSIVPDDLITKAVELNLPIYKTYGLSEMSSQVCTTTPNASLSELQTCGKLLKYRELKIADDSEILVRGEVFCKQYLNAEINIDSEGWFHTGDIGSLDSYSNLTVFGRKDNMFISGGENIYPEPIEKILLQMDNMNEVCIVPKDNDNYGEISVLFYKTDTGQKLSLGQVKEFLTGKINSFEIPKEIYPFPNEYQPLGIKLNRAFLKNWLSKL